MTNCRSCLCLQRISWKPPKAKNTPHFPTAPAPSAALLCMSSILPKPFTILKTPKLPSQTLGRRGMPALFPSLQTFPSKGYRAGEQARGNLHNNPQNFPPHLNFLFFSVVKGRREFDVYYQFFLLSWQSDCNCHGRALHSCSLKAPGVAVGQHLCCSWSLSN